MSCLMELTHTVKLSFSTHGVALGRVTTLPVRYRFRNWAAQVVDFLNYDNFRYPSWCIMCDITHASKK